MFFSHSAINCYPFRFLLSATTSLNLMHRVLKKKKNKKLKIVKNDIFLGSASKQNVFFFKKRLPQNRAQAPNV